MDMSRFRGVESEGRLVHGGVFGCLCIWVHR